jgi:hypothetical protein
MIDWREISPWSARSEINEYLSNGWIVKKMKIKIDDEKGTITGLVLLEFKGEKDETKEDTG